MSQAFWDRFRRRGSGPEEPTPPKDFIEDLLEESRLIGQYRRWKGLPVPDELWQAVSDVDALPCPRRLGDPAIVRLLRVLGECGNGIPFSTLARLKEGWDPCRPSRADRRNTYSLILLSVILVLMTGGMTLLYNKGASLLPELEQMAPAEMDQTYSRLLRDLLQARTQMDSALGDFTIDNVMQTSSDAQVQPGSQLSLDQPSNLLTSAQFDLARNVYYKSEAELFALSRNAEFLSREATRFVDQDARFALQGSRFVRCGLSRTWHLARMLYEFDRNATPTQFLLNYCSERLIQFGSAPRSVSELISLDGYQQLGTAGCQGHYTPAIAASGVQPQIAKPPSSEYVERVAGLARELVCRNAISFLPEQFPSISSSLIAVRDALAPFGLLFLPAFYGAIGAILSLMRVVIDPLTPTPKAPTIFHRVTFGAAAGVVLIWFITPNTLVGTQVADIGLSLFALTFLVGFSLDFFLSILDRFVFVSTSSFARLGEPPTAGTTTTRPAQGATAQI